MTENQYKSKIIRALRPYGYSYYHVDVAAALSGKKPFDGLLIKNGMAMAVEFKKDFRMLEPHQRRALENFDGAAIVIRIRTKHVLKEIMVSYLDGIVPLSTPILYNEFARSFDFKFGNYFKGGKRHAIKKDAAENSKYRSSKRKQNSE